MGGTVTRRVAVALAVAMLVAIAGCSTITGHTATSTPTTTTAEKTITGTFPNPPENLTRASASRTAATYHRALVVRELDPDEPADYDAIPRLDALRTAAIPRRAGGFYVSVRLPAGGQAREMAPDLSRGLYLLAPNATPEPAVPVVGGPTDTYRGDGRSVEPVDLVVGNFGFTDARVSVVITRLDGSPETAMLESVGVPSESARSLEGALATAGRYRVTVIVDGETRSRTVTVGGSRDPPPIGVYLDTEGEPAIYRGPR